ncbi:protein BPS1, chloroplastic-like [Rutidosis leptorrhynchoides]|uniref:protein BPS1, chloroplastic-like n=1 Tax=Rutidosis leptorrhynchoides TaxID=125765 RepID=UPI003A99EF61
MSRPQEPYRQFFPFGNPFRMISPKGSKLSNRLMTLLNKFEETLSERLRRLIPKNKDDILSFSWMKLAMESLCDSHNDIKTLITDLELPVSDWDEKWIDFYLDNSVKLLDVCVAFSSELSRLNQGKLLLQCLLHNLESNGHFTKAHSSLASWRHHIGQKNPRVENCFPILESLVETLDLPKVKNSAKGKVLMRAMYGVKVATIFVFRVSAVAFTGSGKKLSDLSVPETLPWAHAFSVLQSTVYEEMKNKFSSGRATVLREVDEVNVSVKKLDPVIQDTADPIEAETFKSLVTDLGSKGEELSHALDLLGKDVDGFFKIVLTSRDTLLCNLRTYSNVAHTMPKKIMREGQVGR